LINVEIVAEMGASHEQSYQKAAGIVYAAKKCGADTVKVSMFRPDDMTLDRNEKPFLIEKGLWKGQSLYELYRRTSMPFEWIPKLKTLADSLGIKFIVSVYHPRTVELAEKMGIERFKVSSFEINFTELIKKLDKTDKPVIVSTGSASYKEIEAAVKILRRNLTLLKCTSQYPAPIESMNLKSMPAMGHTFRVPCGLSDHTQGLIAPVVATALGAVMLEKHIALTDKSLDAGFALNPHQFRTMVQLVRAAEDSLGEIDYGGEKSFHRELVEGQFVRTVK
jgi:sialic acid synthase SpsE